jgi:hypothetical protein
MQMQSKQELKTIRAQEHVSFRTKNLCTYALMTCALVFTGCAQQQRNTAELIYVPESSGIAETMELAEKVLADMHFSVEKADVENGLIRTKPLPGAQFFELWRGDNVGTENTLLANMHTIRRTVEIDIARQGGQFRIDCNVTVQRLSLPERETFSSARAYEMYSRSSPSLQKLKFDTLQKEGMAWCNLGKDKQLASEILRRIEKQISLRSNNRPTMTGNSS